MVMLNESLATPKNHEHAVQALFDGEASYDGPPLFDFPLYLIAFTNRSGSNLLAEHLHATGKFSGLFEHLNADAITVMAKDSRARSFPGHLSWLISQYRKPGTVFGFKASWDQTAMLVRLGIDRMFTGKTKVIHIVRHDILAQAVSFSIADQTKQWMSTQKANDVQPDYDAKDIEKRIAGICDGNGRIVYLCNVFDLDCLTVFYEDLIVHPWHQMQRIGQWAGYDFSGWVPKSKLKKQASEINSKWVERYKGETARQICAQPAPV